MHVYLHTCVHMACKYTYIHGIHAYIHLWIHTSFLTYSAIAPINKKREVPPLDLSEHYSNAADWALPSLLSWMPVHTLVWVVGLLMCEAKVCMRHVYISYAWCDVYISYAWCVCIVICVHTGHRDWSGAWYDLMCGDGHSVAAPTARVGRAADTHAPLQAYRLYWIARYVVHWVLFSVTCETQTK